MKKRWPIVLLIFFVNIVNIDAQINKPDSSISERHRIQDLLLKKSARQKTAAWILLGTGAGLTIAGGIVGTNAVKNQDNPFDIFPRGSLAGGAMIAGGLAAMVTSVPLFLASARNKKKAHFILQNDSQSLLHRLHHGNIYSVGVSLRL
jgi:hypothetical protein